jgi:7-cyano-7-deazaguanine synthase in queuosine biosynthesis
MKDKIILIFSSGIGFSVLLQKADPQNDNVDCLIFDFGRRLIREIESVHLTCAENSTLHSFNLIL